MDILQAREYFLSKPHSTEGFPFGESVLVFKVGDKMFGLLSMDNVSPTMNLKCDPERAIELREIHSEITPGYHMNKTHWNTVSLDGSLADSLLCGLIDHSYEIIVSSLTKKKRAELGI